MWLSLLSFQLVWLVGCRMQDVDVAKIDCNARKVRRSCLFLLFLRAIEKPSPSHLLVMDPRRRILHANPRGSTDAFVYLWSCMAFRKYTSPSCASNDRPTGDHKKASLLSKLHNQWAEPFALTDAGPGAASGAGLGVKSSLLLAN